MRGENKQTKDGDKVFSGAVLCGAVFNGDMQLDWPMTNLYQYLRTTGLNHEKAWAKMIEGIANEKNNNG